MPPTFLQPNPIPAILHMHTHIMHPSYPMLILPYLHRYEKYVDEAYVDYLRAKNQPDQVPYNCC